MSIINLKAIEKTIQKNREAEKLAEKVEAKKVERNAFEVKKLPKMGNFHSRPQRVQPYITQPVMPPRRLTEWRSGFANVGVDLLVNYCKVYGCDEKVLREEINKSKDLEVIANSYADEVEGIPDLLKGVLTLGAKISKSRMSK